MLRKYRKDYVPQVDESDCGVASLAMILKHYGSALSLAYLRNIAKTTMEGTIALGLVKTAQALGMETQAVKADMSLFEMKDITYPFIVHVVKEETLLHYYVVLKATPRYILIADPAPDVGITKMSYERFEKEGDLTSFIDEYNEKLANKEREVRIYHGMVEKCSKEDIETGVAKGIDKTGALLVEVDGQTKRVVSGEVSVRGLYGYV